MDFIIELVIQIVVQLVFEGLIEVLFDGARKGATYTVRVASARALTGALSGLVFGWFWGHHLSGNTHEPKLLWVSLAVAVVALGLAALRLGQPRPGSTGAPLFERSLVAWPWRWPTERLLNFVLINIALAVGIVVGFGFGA